MVRKVVVVNVMENIYIILLTTKRRKNGFGWRIERQLLAKEPSGKKETTEEKSMLKVLPGLVNKIKSISTTVFNGNPSNFNHLIATSFS